MDAVPDIFGRAGRTATVLALVAGYVDAYATVNHEVFVSFMSGNTTRTGQHLGDAAFLLAWHSFLPIIMFVVGAFVGTLTLHASINMPARWVLLLVAALIALSLILSVPEVLPSWLEVTFLAFAMGAMNPTVTHVNGESVGLAYVTGTLNKMGQHLALALRRVAVPGAKGPWDTNIRRFLVLLGVWFSFVFGAFLGAVGAYQIDEWALAVPAAVVLTIAVLFPPPAPGASTNRS